MRFALTVLVVNVMRLKPWAIALSGWVGIALGVSLLLRGGWGVAPFDAFNSGLARVTGLDVGTASWFSAGAAVLLAWVLGYRPRLGTLFAVVVIGAFINVFLGLIPSTAPLTGLVLSCVGFGVLVVGACLSVVAGVGAGSVETIMVALAAPKRVLGLQLGVRNARWVLEGVLAFAAWLLGGQLGFFTLLLVFLTGPALSALIPRAERLFGLNRHVEVLDEGDLAGR